MPGDADDGAPSTGEAGSTPATKTEAAFRTIGELSADTGLPQHILRYWETRFPQLRPLQRAGNRRYYRAEDVALVRRIDTLLNREGYTVRGVQQLLAGEKSPPAAPPSDRPAQADSPIPALKAIRALLAQALIEDAA
ncbi:MerR family transcriptional regulator [Sphingomonas sp. UV9]|uniref:MerR family transcriptional regulator n=1 Tax=Sphingomonas sp. UV9 TaxID=1851410 RepID=UPI000FFB4EB7|nr:MerR family transcriptional regulator [Sphingomonas sp. UV9]RXD03519.1 MerR family transcriptional regulator [Sphingomonas sp. UV9]